MPDLWFCCFCASIKHSSALELLILERVLPKELNSGLQGFLLE